MISSTPSKNAADQQANTGNASNPLADENEVSQNNQLLNEKAETYLREAGNIEDMPDDNDQQNLDEQLKDG